MNADHLLDKDGNLRIDVAVLEGTNEHESRIYGVFESDDDAHAAIPYWKEKARQWYDVETRFTVTAWSVHPEGHKPE